MKIMYTEGKIWKRAAIVIAIPFIILFVCASMLMAQPAINSVTYTPNPAGCYEKFELTIDLTASYTNPFDPDDIDLWAIFTSPNSGEWNIKGFWDGTNWKIRFAANETGMWSFIVSVDDGAGQASTSNYNFTCESSSHPGWLRVSSSDPHFLCHDDGSAFYGIGQCRPWNLGAVPNIFSDMQSHGVNLLVYWMPHWDNMLVTMTTGYDHYDMVHAANIDNVIEACEEHDICLMLTIWNHDELRGSGHSWGNPGFEGYNPFSLLSTATGFMSDATSWSYQQKLYRYIIARWGYSRAIGQWHTVCEIDGTTNTYNNDAATDPWHIKINNYFKNNDPFSHPTTASKSGDKWWPIGYAAMDIPQIHSYDKANDAVGIADRLAYWTRRMWKGFDKPNVIGEFGTSSTYLQPRHLHNGLWASVSAGAAITALDWNDGNTFGDFNAEMYDHCSYLADFISGIQFDQSGLDTTLLSINTEFKAWGMNGSNFGYLWVQDTSPGESNSGTSLTISGLTNGVWELNWYNTWTGSYYAAPVTENCSGNSITTTIPDFTNDIACRITLNDFVVVQPKIFLEGCYDSNGDNMRTDLSDEDLLPLNQPYNVSPWNYNGYENVAEIPAPTVDWILVELRTGTEASTKVAVRAAFVKNYGSIVDIDGSSGVTFPGITGGDYYIVIYHRNHLAVMSASAVTLGSTSTLYDFTTSSSQFYGTDGAKELESGVWGMWSGDINQDKQITTSDYTFWYNSARGGDSGYQVTDINLDAQVTTSDYTIWYNNARAGASSQVP